jgi:hypothetical protein
MAMNRKALFYTLVAVIFLAVIIVVFGTYNKYKFQDRQEVYETRIRTMNDFIRDFQSDISRATYISTFRAMLAMEEYVSKTGQFIESKTKTEELFREAFNNGSINGVQYPIMNESDFQNYLGRVNAKARQIDIAIAANVTGVSIIQSDPWHLNVSFDIHVIITDMKGLAGWTYDSSTSTLVPIDDLKDPLYTVKTQGAMPNTIRRMNQSMMPLVDDTSDTNTTTGLAHFINQSYYWNNTRAPSLLQRFYGDMSASPYGIESIIRLDSLQSQNPVLYPIRKYQSSIDYLYFNETQTYPLICNIQNANTTTNWLVLDENHSNDYGVSGQLCYANVSVGTCAGAMTCPT